MAKESDVVRESFFNIRSLFHELYGSDVKVKAAYPPSYDGVRQLTYLIQKSRDEQKQAAIDKKAAAAARKVLFSIFLLP